MRVDRVVVADPLKGFLTEGQPVIQTQYIGSTKHVLTWLTYIAMDRINKTFAFDDVALTVLYLMLCWEVTNKCAEVVLQKLEVGLPLHLQPKHFHGSFFS